MLIQTDKLELGDLRLNPEEGLAKLKEENAVRAEKRKINNQGAYEDQKEALGRPLQFGEFIHLLKKANPAIIVEDGGVKGAVAIRYVINGEKVYVSGLYKETLPGCTVLPEHSAVITDARGIALREIRGWRNVLTSLLKVGALSMDRVTLIFGLPGSGKRGTLWMNSAKEAVTNSKRQEQEQSNIILL
jgi:hypothetical protein